MSTAVKIASRVRELRIHLCQVGASSKGVRDFITQHYVPIKSANPKFPILIRECSGVQPRLWARYDMGKETSVSLTNLKPAEILEQFKTITQ